MTFLELGNTSIKLAQDIGDNTFLLERFTTVRPVLARIASTPGAIVCAPVAKGYDEILHALSSRDQTTIITIDTLRDFVDDSYDTPNSLGIDRILNVIGLERDALVISCGTAITVDARINGKPLWGAIMPGFTTAAEGLHDRVRALPLVDIHHTPLLPARTSVQSVTNGILLGTARAAQSLAMELAAVASREEIQVVLTGGDAQVLERLWSGAITPIVDEMLIFSGMSRVTATGGR